jgi:class 3 adenylate cyclase/HAMP domain-containing protein
MLKNIFSDFWKGFKKRKASRKKDNVRKVYFGLRSRFLGLVSLAIILIISVFTVLMYLNQIKLLGSEKNEKAGTLAQILSGPAESYLDKNISTTKEEFNIKYQAIIREVENFKKYNEDIVKIMLTDDKGKVLVSTFAGDVNRTPDLPYIRKCLTQLEDKLDFYDFQIKSKDKTKTKLRAITYPIFLRSGTVVETLNDYNKYFDKFHNASKAVKNNIYQILWEEYKKILGKEYDPGKITMKNAMSGKIIKAGDIDFLFLKIFADIMASRDKRIKMKDAWLWNDRWLYELKENKMKLYRDDNSNEAKKVNDLIMERMNNLYKQIDQIRRLGTLSILFDVDKINRDFSHNIKTAMNIALWIFLFSVILFLFVINFMISNLKKLEKWAVEVGNGDIDTRLEIKTRDEIGRISDIFNNMLDELKMKFHLEKFVSSSTRKMIEKRNNNLLTMELGKTGRKNFAFIFSDVRGFTPFSEKNDPDTVIEVLNLYLDLQARIIHARKGDIDQYVGDEIMAHFSGENMADKAIETAIEIIETIHKFNRKRRAENLPVFEVGIGVHGGDVVVGNIGSGFRMNYTSVGDTVNLTSRLCSSAKAGEIIVSEELFSKAKKTYHKEKAQPITVKGKSESISVVKVIV